MEQSDYGLRYVPFCQYISTILDFNTVDTLSGEATQSFHFEPPLSTGINSLRKEFAPLGANSFL